MPATFETFCALDARLVAAGGKSHPCLDFWRESAARPLYEHPTADVFIGEAGRGSGKSGFATDIGLNETLYGAFDVPVGEVHFWIDVSENKREARQRTLQYETRLKALGIPYEQRGDEIILPELRRGFLVLAAEVGRVSGYRAFGFRIDEGAKLSSDGANPVSELWASCSAMTVTHLRKRPKRLLLSSPVGLTGFFNDRVTRGTTDDQIVVSRVPTWIANPTITEADTRALEPDDRIWRREYLAVPQPGELCAFPSDHVERIRTPRPFTFTPAGKVLVLDPSSGGLASRDRFTWAVASWCVDDFDGDKFVRDVEGQATRWATGVPVESEEYKAWKARGPRAKPYLQLHEIGGIKGGFSGTISADQIADQIASVARAHRVRVVHSDQRESLFLSGAMERRRFTFHSHVWSNSSKQQAVTLVRRWLADGTLYAPTGSDELVRELLSFEETISSSGMLTFGSRRGGHDDYVALLITLAHAELSEFPLPKSTTQSGPPRGHLSDTPEGMRIAMQLI